MLESYGLHSLVWNTCDDRFGDVLVASPADAQGRGIALAVKDSGTAVNLTGATVYLVWRHRVTKTRGTEAFTFVSAASGTCKVYYPAAMQEAQGTVDAQIMISLGSDRYISSRAFAIRVEPVLVGGTEHTDGFTLFENANYLFSSCGSLQSIYATSYDSSTIESDTVMLTYTKQLVGADGTAASSSSGKEQLRLTAGGLLTNPNSDTRQWVWGHVYSDGTLEVTASSTPDASKTLVSSGRVCTAGKYTASSAIPWNAQRTSIAAIVFKADLEAIATMAAYYWFYGGRFLCLA